MPKPGYKVVTIEEKVYNQATEEIERINEEAGFKKIRNVSHYVEQAIVEKAIDIIKRSSESPEVIIEKVVEVMWNRPALLKGVFDRLLKVPEEEAVELMRGLFSTEEMEHLKRICTTVKPRKKQRGVKAVGGKGHFLIDMGGKILYMNETAQFFLPDRKVGDFLLDGKTSLTQSGRKKARDLLERVLTSKEEIVDQFEISYKDGRTYEFDGSARLVPGNDDEKVFEIFFDAVQVKKVES